MATSVNLPGMTLHPSIVLSSALAYQYKRLTKLQMNVNGTIIVIYLNDSCVVLAFGTHQRDASLSMYAGGTSIIE